MSEEPGDLRPAGPQETGLAMPEVPETTHRLIRANGVEQHVAEAGSGEPVVLLHGFPQHWYVWHRLIPSLAGRYRVIVPDLRGSGWSEAPPSGYDKETLARDVLALLDQLEVEQFRLAGHDWGAWVGALIALFEPQRVSRLVMMSQSLPFMRLTPRWVANFWHLWHGQVMSAPGLWRRAVQGRAPFGPAIFNWLDADRWSDEERQIYLEQFQEPARSRAAHELYRSVGRLDMPRTFRGRYRRMAPLRPPTLLLYGQRDKTVQPAHFASGERYADDLTIEYLDCGHAIPEERPEDVQRLTEEFFAS
jgi:pimeloyl-ACP methyl ester carboxylesterase